MQSKIVDVLKQLKNSSSPGPDRINQRILKEVAEEISFPLLLLFIKSMRTSKVPADWKIANVSPIFKKGSKFDPANYRPISLTSIIVKIMERILKEAIMKHLLENSLIK